MFRVPVEISIIIKPYGVDHYAKEIANISFEPYALNSELKIILPEANKILKRTLKTKKNTLPAEIDLLKRTLKILMRSYRRVIKEYNESLSKTA